VRRDEAAKLLVTFRLYVGEAAMDLDSLEKSLAGKPYEVVEVELAPLDTEQLIALLDCRSIRVGDTAADLLVRRGETEAVIDATLAGRVSTKIGKQRALNILTWLGRACARARDIYLALLKDRHETIVGGALFGLVFLQAKEHEGAIREAMKAVRRDSELYERFKLALEALHKGDPFIFSPYFHDVGDVWKLDKARFCNRVGPIC